MKFINYKHTIKKIFLLVTLTIGSVFTIQAETEYSEIYGQGEYRNEQADKFREQRSEYRKEQQHPQRESNGTNIYIDSSDYDDGNELYEEMEREQWNDTRSLRTKVNKRAEKEWDRVDSAFDEKEDCLKSADIRAYWEPHTMRCLDRKTGSPLKP